MASDSNGNGKKGSKESKATPYKKSVESFQSLPKKSKRRMERRASSY